MPKLEPFSAKDFEDKTTVVHPQHYNHGHDGLETFDIINHVVEYYDKGEIFYIGNAVKYLDRACFKGAKRQDLEKAVYYIQRVIDRLESKQ